MKKVLMIVMLMTGIINSIFSQYPFIISSYIRGNFYNNGRNSAMSMNECTDLICIGILPEADGSLLYQRFTPGDEYDISGYGDLISSVRSKLINNNIR